MIYSILLRNFTIAQIHTKAIWKFRVLSNYQMWVSAVL